MRRAHNRQNGRVLLFAAIVVTAAVMASHALGIFVKPAGLVDKLCVDYVIIDLSKGKFRVSPEIASTSDGTESLDSMVKRLKPYALVTGTYYDENNRPLGDIVSGGKVIRRGCQRQGIGFTSSGKIKFFERKGCSKIDWRGCVSGIACGPRLVRLGKKDINVKRDGFKSAAATNKAWRCALGATKDGKLILCAVSQSITLSTLADVMLELGARDAINMDGGGMCAMYVDGKYKVEAVKPMSNILAVYKTK
ncbi:MAG: phosphodiester glycosidase family protein [Armatimonadota bacterium]|nr:phosphodiester glycosidase family protein [bacterium]